MPLKTYRPTTPGRRGMARLERPEITKQQPEKSLLEPRPQTGGGNTPGRG